MRTIHYYEAKDGWRWRAMRAGRIVEESGEAYSSKRAVKRAIAAKLKATYRVVD